MCTRTRSSVPCTLLPHPTPPHPTPLYHMKTSKKPTKRWFGFHPVGINKDTSMNSLQPKEKCLKQNKESLNRLWLSIHGAWLHDAQAKTETGILLPTSQLALARDVTFSGPLTSIVTLCDIIDLWGGARDVHFRHVVSGGASGADKMPPECAASASSPQSSLNHLIRSDSNGLCSET